MNRAEFIKLGFMMSAMPLSKPQSLTYAENKIIDFVHDGIQLTPQEYATLLMKLADEGKIKPDYYSNEGVVEEMEIKFAQALGKEAAVFIPTGTLANHMAIRKLAGTHRRVLIQEQSHLYNDSGDCAQTLSNLNLIPLGTNKVEIPAEELDYIIKKTKTGRVELKIGAISIETPVRRLQDRIYHQKALSELISVARQNEIKTHLDGARLFVQSAHTSIPPSEYGKMFDTVYTSLWKCFNAPSGAVLAGSKSFTEGLFHERRMFGGSLPAAWPYAAVALYFSDYFIPEYKKAWTAAEKLFTELQKDERLKISTFDQGTHIAKLELKNINAVNFRKALLKNQIEVNEPVQNVILLKVNPTLNRVVIDQTIAGFTTALKSL